MRFILLTHSKEVSKKNNTGQLIRSCFANTLCIIWQRTQPDKKLLTFIKTGDTALVYPTDEVSEPSQLISDYENFILIDGTWQEARKIYNRSAYLHYLPRINISTDQTSIYTLRRNQVVGGMCTAECAIALLQADCRPNSANKLDAALRAFISRVAQ